MTCYMAVWLPSFGGDARHLQPSCEHVVQCASASRFRSSSTHRMKTSDFALNLQFCEEHTSCEQMIAYASLVH